MQKPLVLARAIHTHTPFRSQQTLRSQAVASEIRSSNLTHTIDSKSGPIRKITLLSLRAILDRGKYRRQGKERTDPGKLPASVESLESRITRVARWTPTNHTVLVATFPITRLTGTYSSSSADNFRIARHPTGWWRVISIRVRRHRDCVSYRTCDHLHV